MSPRGLSAAEVAHLLKARDHAARVLAQNQSMIAAQAAALQLPESARRELDRAMRAATASVSQLRALEATSRQVESLASRQSLLYTNLLPMPLAPASDADKANLEAENERLRAERDLYRSKLRDLLLTEAFGGFDNEVFPDDLSEN